MTVKFLAPNRMEMTQDGFNSQESYNDISAWKKIGEYRSKDGQTTWTISDLPVKKKLMIIYHDKLINTVYPNNLMQFNGDSTANYAFKRLNYYDTTEDSFTSQTGIRCDGLGGYQGTFDAECFMTFFIDNTPNREKLIFGRGGGNKQLFNPTRSSPTWDVAKWCNTTDPITSITWTITQGTAENIYVCVLAFDPDDTTTPGFFKKKKEVIVNNTPTSVDLDWSTEGTEDFYIMSVNADATGAIGDVAPDLITFNNNTDAVKNDFKWRIDTGNGNPVTGASKWSNLISYYDSFAGNATNGDQETNFAMFFVFNMVPIKFFYSFNHMSNAGGTDPSRYPFFALHTCSTNETGMESISSVQFEIDQSTVSGYTWKNGSTFTVWGGT